MAKENASEEHDRLIEIETKLAYQEDLLQSLNDVVVEQRTQIDALQLRVKKLAEQLGAGNENEQLSGQPGGSVEDELPPHY